MGMKVCSLLLLAIVALAILYLAFVGPGDAYLGG